MTDSFKPLETAVLFIVFNRPDTTEKVFEAIRMAKPPRLYIAADGPRSNCTGDLEKVSMVRKIATSVDWLCEVKTLFREDNLGCKHAVSGGINWFFENEEQGIILEDDCLPSTSFFYFCEQLLNYYKNNEKIFLITGHNKQENWIVNNEDYFFSFFGGIWGWASWRRAWLHYNSEEILNLNDMIKNNIFIKQMGMKLGSLRQKQFLKVKDQIINNKLNTWDYQWALTRHKHGGISCVPCTNLIENIGFTQDATHTTNFRKKIKNHEISLPIKINHNTSCDYNYDYLFIKKNFLQRIFNLIMKYGKKFKSK